MKTGVSHSQPSHSEYSRYLSSMAGVKACVDIYNANGVLLLRKGETISPRRGELLAIHKLIQPLNQSVTLENALSAEQILDSLNELINQHEDLVLLENSWLLTLACSDWVAELMEHPLPQQMLTVMAEKLPALFQESLLVAWLSCGIAKGMKLGKSQQRDIFFTGLLHDVGMLYLPNRLVTSKEKYSAEDWKRMQSHTVLGFKLLSQCKGLAVSVRRGAVEHHERTDGSGYPRGLQASDIDIGASIVAIADTLNAVRFGKGEKSLKSLRQALPILQVSGDQYDHQARQAAIYEILKACPAKLRYSADEMPSISGKIAQQLTRLQRNHSELSNLLAELGRYPANNKYQRSLILSIEHFVETVNRSGLFLDNLPHWLEAKEIQLDDTDTSSQLALEESLVLVREFDYLFKRIVTKTQLMLEQKPPEQLKQALTALMAPSTAAEPA